MFTTIILRTMTKVKLNVLISHSVKSTTWLTPSFLLASIEVLFKLDAIALAHLKINLKFLISAS